MTDDERLARLDAELAGSGAQVNGPFQIWALDSQLTDAHLIGISSWADLDFLMAAGCPVTDAGLASICRFRRLTSLDIGGTAITADAIATADLPGSRPLEIQAGKVLITQPLAEVYRTANAAFAVAINVKADQPCMITCRRVEVVLAACRVVVQPLAVPLIETPNTPLGVGCSNPGPAVQVGNLLRLLSGRVPGVAARSRRG